MKTIEYRFDDTHDRSKWGNGPWNDEPDKKQWTDEATGLPCLIVRNNGGALCGYVGVSEGHPAFSVDYDRLYGTWDDDYTEMAPGPVPGISVHGGLTFSDFCSPSDKEHGICHIVEPGENDRVWWLGFDTAHYGDYVPAYDGGIGHRDEYKDLAYVTAECESLARQLASAA